MKTFRLIVSSPDGNKFDGEAVKLDVRGTEGELAIMAGHIPFVTSLVKSSCTGKVRTKKRLQLWTEDSLQLEQTL